MENNQLTSSNRFMPLIAVSLVLTGAYLYDKKRYAPSLQEEETTKTKKKINSLKRLEKIVASSQKKGFLQTLRRAVEKREKV